MEAISGGASVLAFVVLGLKSAKVAYQVLSAIKDGSTHVAQARSSVHSLQSTLERLSQCRLVAEQHDAGLLKTAKECADNMKAFAEQLEKLAKSKHWVDKQWKKVKIFLKEDDLKRVSAAVVGHTAALNFYLQVLESDTILGVRDDVRTMLPIQQTIHDDVKAILPLLQTIGETQTTILTQHTMVSAMVQNSITQNQNEAQTIRETSQPLTQGWLAQTDIQHINDRLNRVTAAEQGSITQNHNEAQAIRETIQTSTQGLSAQTGIQYINDLLDRLLRSRPSQETTAAPRVVDVSDDGSMENMGQMDHEDNLEAIIFFVVEALQDRSGIFAGDEAQEICDALFNFLHKAFLSENPCSSKSVPTGARDGCDDSDLRALQVHLRAVKGAILSSRRVSVNQGGDSSTSQHFVDGKILISRNTVTRQKTLEHRSGTISVLTTKSFSKTQNSSPTMGKENSIYTTETRIIFTPRLQDRVAKGQGFEAILRNSQGYQGWQMPRLFLNNVIHESSPVFRVVENGDLAMFKDMLIRGKASLRDQDQYGISLLFYAHHQPNMYRFLLEHGADVNHWAPFLQDRMKSGNAIVKYPAKYRGSNGTDSKSQIEESCQGLLFNAGCDPNTYIQPRISTTETRDNTFLAYVLQFGNIDILRLLSASGFVYAFAQSADFHDGKTLLQTYISGDNVTIEGLSMILRHGADINARCSEGRSCLHYFILSFKSARDFNPIDSLAACEYLIRSGADVDAVDNSGRSALWLAYTPAAFMNGFLPDMCDRALAGAGFDVASFHRRYGIRRPAKDRYRNPGSNEDDEGQSNIYDASDQDSVVDSDRDINVDNGGNNDGDNEADIDDDSDNGNNEEGGCRLD